MSDRTRSQDLVNLVKDIADLTDEQKNELFRKIKDHPIFRELYTSSLIPSEFRFFLQAIMPRGVLRKNDNLMKIANQIQSEQHTQPKKSPAPKKSTKKPTKKPTKKSTRKSTRKSPAPKKSKKRSVSPSAPKPKAKNQKICHYDDVSCEHKDDHNQLLVPTIKEYLEAEAHCLILDGAEMKTSAALLTAGVKGTNICIAEREQDTYRKMLKLQKSWKKDGKENIPQQNIVYRTDGLRQFITEYGEQYIPRLNIFYLDYMCTMVGSNTDNCHPPEDIDNIFALIPPGRQFILATTFCLRDPRGGDNECIIEKERDKIAGLTFKHNIRMNCKLENGCKYRRNTDSRLNMHYNIYVFQKLLKFIPH